MKTHEITDTISLCFDQVKENFFPKLKMADTTINIPLLVEDHEIEIITKKLVLINFCNLPLHYIEKIVSGCITTVLKYPTNN